MENMPLIKLPFCTQNEFENAVKTVEMCKVERPVWGFTHPFFAPGGAYGECSVKGLVLPDGCTLNVTVKEGKVTCEYDGKLKVITE